MCSFEQFEVIYKVFMDSTIPFQMLQNAKDLLDYYCIDLNDIRFEYNSNINPMNFSFSDDLIIGDSENMTSSLLDFVKCYELPYISFKVIFVSGELCDIF